jgi:hypothetical protein
MNPDRVIEAPNREESGEAAKGGVWCSKRVEW